MRSGKLVYKQIAANACTVIAVITPAKQSNRFKWPLGRIAQEPIPINVLRRSICRNGVLPRAERPTSPQTGIHQIQGSNFASGHQLSSFLVNDGTGKLAAALENSLGALLRFDQCVSFFQLLHDGLFAIHILARVHRINRNALMPMIRRGNDDRVNVRARQHFAVITRGENVFAPDFFDVRQPSIVNVGGGHKLHAFDAQRCFRVAMPHSACADLTHDTERSDRRACGKR